MVLHSCLDTTLSKNYEFFGDILYPLNMCVFLWKFSIFFGGEFFLNFSHLSLHDEPDGESDVGRVLSGLTVEGSHHDDVRRLESDENDEGSLQLERRWRRKRDGGEGGGC